MREITLVRVPGAGASRVQVSDDMTVEQLITAQDLHGRAIIINGESVATTAYKTKTLRGAVEVFATGPVKGA